MWFFTLNMYWKNKFEITTCNTDFPHCKVIIVHIEYQNVCPFVGIGSPLPPRQQASVSPPLGPKGGGATLPCGWGGGGPNSDDWKESLALCILCAPPPLRCWIYYSMKFIYSIHICRRLKCCCGPSLIIAIFFLPIFLTFRKKFYPSSRTCTAHMLFQLLI